MYVAIVKQKYGKKKRWWFYILYYTVLLTTFPLLITLNVDKSIAGILFAALVLASLLLIDKLIEDVEVIGKVEIKTDSFVIIQNGKKTPVPFNAIQMFLLTPLIGVSRVAETYKAYDCQIRTNEKNHRLALTRAEVRNGKIITKNLIRPNAFDLIKLLKRQNINYRIEL